MRSKEEKGRQTPRRKQNRVACTKTEINCGIPNYLVAIVHRMNECICVGPPKLSLSHTNSQPAKWDLLLLCHFVYYNLPLNYIETNEPEREKEREKPNENGRINGHNQ